MTGPLPVDAHIADVVTALRTHGAAVVVAPPGAGKTTRIPPALCSDGRVLLLQPRRVAARSIARRIADENGWTLEAEVGWQVRYERRYSERTRLLVATEGILTARLQSDPLLSDFTTVVLDEFHERSLHADLALALTKQAARAREALRILVMSATLEARSVAAFLGDCPVLEIAGRTHPTAIRYAPALGLPEAVRDVLERQGGHVLCFLPGAAEIERAARALGRLSEAADVRPLHGSLTPEAQDLALAPSRRRKVLLATNLAETSLTVDGVTDVVDGGLHKLLRYDVEKGIDRLETERIGQDSAAQRAGRAGRQGPGRVLRLWDARDKLREHREPEIQRVDLASPVLEVLAWGGDPFEFEWFERPPDDRLRAAMGLLERIGAVAGRRLTDVGRRLHALPVHPRLARMLEATGGARRAALLAALLSEPHAKDRVAIDAIERIDRAEAEAESRHLRAVARDLVRRARQGLDCAVPRDDDEALRRAVLAAYPDRVVQRRASGSRRFLLASGHGATVAADPPWGQYAVALDVVAAERGGVSEALIRLGCGVETAWLSPTERTLEHRYDETARRVRASETAWYDRLPLSQRLVEPDPAAASAVLADVLRRDGLGAENEAFLRRARFAGVEVDLEGVLMTVCEGQVALPEFSLPHYVSAEVLRSIEALAPAALRLPSGRAAPIEYAEGEVRVSAKLQELFGLGETPRLGPQPGLPIVFSLLAPNGRPVQTTRDLHSFWERTYPEVRKELRGRYPRHPWPEDPWNAEPTARAKRKPR